MLVNTFLPLPELITGNTLSLIQKGFAITLFLIGTDLSIKVISAIGIKSVLFSVVLWAPINILSFVVITVL